VAAVFLVFATPRYVARVSFLTPFISCTGIDLTLAEHGSGGAGLPNGVGVHGRPEPFLGEGPHGAGAAGSNRHHPGWSRHTQRDLQTCVGLCAPALGCLLSSTVRRIIESLGSEGTLGHLVQPPRSEQGHR